jgi:hypothetical protein
MYIPEIWVGFVLGVVATFVLLLLLSALSDVNSKRHKF